MPHFQRIMPRLPVADLRRSIDFYTKDPEGYLVIFSEPTDDSPTCPEE